MRLITYMTYNSAIGLCGLSDVFAERLSSIVSAASKELTMTMGCPRMSRYTTSPTGNPEAYLSPRTPRYEIMTTTYHTCQPCPARKGLVVWSAYRRGCLILAAGAGLGAEAEKNASGVSIALQQSLRGERRRLSQRMANPSRR